MYSAHDITLFYCTSGRSKEEMGQGGVKKVRMGGNMNQMNMRQDSVQLLKELFEARCCVIVTGDRKILLC